VYHAHILSLFGHHFFVAHKLTSTLPCPQWERRA